MSTPPLVPRPVVTLVTIAAMGGLFLNMWLDSRPGDYDGKWAYLALSTLIASAYGIDIGRIWRGSGKEKDEP